MRSYQSHIVIVPGKESSATIDFSPGKAANILRAFLSEKLGQSGLDGYVVGLSGGIDSAVSTALAVAAIGQGKVLAVMMPYRTSSPDSATDALALAHRLGIEHRQVDISPMIDAYFDDIDKSNRLRAGNKMSRERMAILFDIAHQTNCLVLGTGNRTEICLGYTTWYGDSACSVNPIGELYKTEVRLLAEELGVPKAIRNKPPTADLWSGQTDEGEIGVTYDEIDRLLRRLIDDGITSRRALEKEGFEAGSINRVVTLLNRNAFKRRLPDVASLGRVVIPDCIELCE
ncbi:MAG: NAD+ synthase [bacterium]